MKNTTLNRRHFISQMLGASLLISGCERKSPIQRDIGLIKSFGLTEQRGSYRRIYAAGAPAELLLYALVPQWLIGWSRQKSAQTMEFLSSHAQLLPFLGSINGRGSTVSLETLMKKKVDLIVDMGERTPAYVSTAARVSAQLKIPYLLLDGRLALAPEQIKQLGYLVSSPNIEQLTSLSQRAIAFAATVAADINQGIHIYYAGGADGLETGRKNSIHTEVINLLGAKNCADALGEGGLTKVTLEQIIDWQPDMIVTQNQKFIDMAYSQPAWNNVKAVANKAIYLLPALPYGWIDSPPSLNRLLGIYALAPILQQLRRNYYADEIQELYQGLYHTQLTYTQLQYLGLS